MATLVQTAENELKFGEDAEHIHVPLNILVMEVSTYVTK
jgi:hypothetical protein